jgi:hypothetical protein
LYLFESARERKSYEIALGEKKKERKKDRERELKRTERRVQNGKNFKLIIIFKFFS